MAQDEQQSDDAEDQSSARRDRPCREMTDICAADASTQGDLDGILRRFRDEIGANLSRWVELGSTHRHSQRIECDEADPKAQPEPVTPQNQADEHSYSSDRRHQAAPRPSL